MIEISYKKNFIKKIWNKYIGIILSAQQAKIKNLVIQYIYLKGGKTPKKREREREREKERKGFIRHITYKSRSQDFFPNKSGSQGLQNPFAI